MVISEMKEVCFLANVKCGSDNTSRYVSSDGTPWLMSLDGGIVTIQNKKTGDLTHVPLTNVAFMIPKKAPEAAKAPTAFKK